MTRIELIEIAQQKLEQVIEILEVGFGEDTHAQTYLTDHLKARLNSHHGFMTSDMNFDDLYDRYCDDDTEIDTDEFGFDLEGDE